MKFSVDGGLGSVGTKLVLFEDKVVDRIPVLTSWDLSETGLRSS